MADGSTKVVYAALAGNLLVTAAKAGAALASGSSAMLTEAIHSAADSSNQILLLIGTWRSRRRADRTHAFGYGMEIYFWTFVVAVIVFLLGGVASIVEGIGQLRQPKPITSPLLSLGVLAAAMLFEGASFAVGYREYKRVATRHQIAGQTVSMWRFIALSKDPNLYESLLEDSAALAGIAIAAAGVVGSAYLDIAWADGAASLAIGALLVGVSLVVAEATRSLVAGEAAAPPLLADIRHALDGRREALDIRDVRTLHLGPRRILIAVTVNLAEGQSNNSLRRAVDEVTATLKAVDKRISDIYFRFT